MKTFPWLKTSLIILFGLLLWNYFDGIPSVPFHPDESTQIYMSADLSSSPDVLGYVPGQTIGDKWRYRLIDSPLSRTWMGWALNLNNISPNQVDWDWSKDWDTNQSAGALPSEEALFTARWAVAWVFPLTCLFLYLLAKKLGGWPTAVVTVILFAGNALVLIHTRRALAESVLLCMVTALAWLMVDIKSRPWFTAIAAGLAVNAKQTAFPLAGLAGLEMVLLPKTVEIKKRLVNLTIFLSVILAVSLALNPAYWQYPVDAIKEGLRQRQDLSDRIRVDYHTSGNPLEQTVNLISQVFIQPPAAYDVMNYEEATRPAVNAYMARPQNNLFRGFSGGMTMLILTLSGYFVIWKQTGRDENGKRMPFLIYSTITLVCVIMLMIFTSAPFQRYYVILVPFFSIAQAAALVFFLNSAIELIKKRTAVSGRPG
jgi:4-amino-4-deoxy-L-arabinose transferase-like glycosyltransferase